MIALVIDNKNYWDNAHTEFNSLKNERVYETAYVT